ncbi:glucuronate isomerase [Microbacterium sp.]|jgi:glucuronate isomerase|uniref:glucuronate isomerase n=1 Tax=Microbacterium sp. TaxID=51671 RepID=UPI0037C69901
MTAIATATTAAEGSMLLDDEAFPDPTRLLLSGDHYVTRLLQTAGVDPAELGVGGVEVRDPRRAWRSFCENWDVLSGTASGYWLTDELSRLFGIDREPSASSADALYDVIADRLQQPNFRPRRLLDRFRIEVLATTDDPMDDLDVHRALADDAHFDGRVIPTFRPDAYLDPEAPGFLRGVERLAQWHGTPTDDYTGYLEGLESRRAHFIAHGATSADHGVVDALAEPLASDEAAALFRRAVRSESTPAEARAFRAHMLFQMAGMSVRDGLVMTIHPGVLRNHHTETYRSFGPDTGHDIPVATEYTRNLRPLLEEYGLAPDFHLVLFTVDETTFSREIAPLAGFYPSVFIGPPWWFLDAPDAILRFRAATTEIAGFSRSAGFIDDTRAFLSIPARHDMARRVDASYLARLVAEGRIGRARAQRIIVDLTDAQPRKVFKL